MRKWSTEAYSAFFMLFFPPLSLTLLGRVLNSLLFTDLICFTVPTHTCLRVAALCCCVHACTVALLFNITAQGEIGQQNAASVTAAKRKEVLLEEEWGEDPGNRAKMVLTG